MYTCISLRENYQEKVAAIVEDLKSRACIIVPFYGLDTNQTTKGRLHACMPVSQGNKSCSQCKRIHTNISY